MTTFGDMVYELGGAPVSGNRFTSPWATHYFVDGDDGSDGNSGLRPNQAKASIDAAVQVMSEGDVLYIKPQAYVAGTGMGRYDEAATVDINQESISIIGCGYPGANEFGVRWRKSTSGYAIDVLGPCIHVENIGFLCNSTATGLFRLQHSDASTAQGANGAIFYGCHFKYGENSIQGGWGSKFINCVFIPTSGAGGAVNLTIATATSTSHNLMFKGCWFCDDNSTAPTHEHIYATAGEVHDILITDCCFGLVPTTSTSYITITGGTSTGLINNCGFIDDDLTVSTSSADINVDAGIKIANIIDDSGTLPAST